MLAGGPLYPAGRPMLHGDFLLHMMYQHRMAVSCPRCMPLADMSDSRCSPACFFTLWERG